MFIDSQGHEVKIIFDKRKGTPFTTKYFGEAIHLDGTIACDGSFKEKREEKTKE